MPDIMPSIISGILTPDNAGLAQPDACGSPLLPEAARQVASELVRWAGELDEQLLPVAAGSP
jgi:hypothetical protein